MQTCRLLLLILLCLVLNSCSRIRVSLDFAPDYPFTSSMTYNWHRTLQTAKAGLLLEDDLLAKRFTDSVNHNLQSRQIELNKTPDLLVSCSYTIIGKIYSEPVLTRAGFGVEHYGRLAGFGIYGGTNIHQYEEGKLIISFHETTTDRLVWKGIGTREVYTHFSPKALDKFVKNLVNEVLEQFPPHQ